MSNPVTTAVTRMTGQMRSWLGNWPMSEFPRVFGAGPTSAGVDVSEYTALNYSAVWAAVSIISADIASLPLILYKRTSNGGKERYTDSSLYELLHDAPNPEMTAMVFREALQAHVMTWGNAYAEIQRDQVGRPVALWPITPDRVTPFREGGGALGYRVTNSNGRQVVIAPRNMLHIPGLGFDGVTGYSVIQHARESIALGVATERFGETFFRNGSTFGGVLSHPEKLTTEVKQGIRESADALHTGVDRAHKFLILGGGMKYDRLGIPPNDAQFLETRRFQINEVARWFGIPPHKIGDLERATFTNIEQQDIEYYRSGLRRWLVRWEQEYQRKLISPLERRQQFVKHNVEGLLRGDSTARAAFYTSMFNVGAYSINMILESEDLNKIGPEGDVHFVQGNLQPADLAKDGMMGQLPTVEKVEALPPGKDDEDEPGKDDAERALEELRQELIARDAELRDLVIAQRDALTVEQLDAHVAALAAAEAERAQVQQQFEELRERQAAEAEAAAEAIAAATQALSDAETARTIATVDKTNAEVQAVQARSAQEEAERAAAAEAESRQQAEVAAVAAQAAAQADAAEARALAQQKEAEAAAANQAADALRAQVDAALAAAAQAEHDAEATLKAHQDAEAERMAGMVAAHRALIVDAMGRMVRRETEKARRYQATSEKLRTWADSFYVVEEERWVESLRPAVRAHLAWLQSSEDVDTVTVGLVREHYAESVRQLRAVIDSEPEEMHKHLERMLLRWENERPNALADRILSEEVNHVRTSR